MDRQRCHGAMIVRHYDDSGKTLRYTVVQSYQILSSASPCTHAGRRSPRSHQPSPTFGARAPILTTRAVPMPHGTQGARCSSAYAWFAASPQQRPCRRVSAATIPEDASSCAAWSAQGATARASAFERMERRNESRAQRSVNLDARGVRCRAPRHAALIESTAMRQRLPILQACIDARS